MDYLNEIVEKLSFEKNIEIEDIPNIDLYIDQVIQLFESTFGQSKRNEDEKILTKTMINNYAKGKIFFPVKNKKYSKEHIMLISLIYQLKGALTINDIKALLEGVNEKVMNEDFELDAFYRSLNHLNKQNVEIFTEEIKVREEQVNEEMIQLPEEDQDFRQVLLIASLVQMSNMYRRVAERLVDELVQESSD